MKKKFYVCIHEIKLVSHFSWQFIIFNWIVKLVRLLAHPVFINLQRIQSMDRPFHSSTIMEYASSVVYFPHMLFQPSERISV
jgi:hypothetical protein